MRGGRWEGITAPCRSAQTGPESDAWKLLLWTAVAGADLRPHRLRRDRRGLAARRPQQLPQASASGDIVILGDRRQVASRNRQLAVAAPLSTAKLVDRLTAVGAKRIFFDVNFSSRFQSARRPMRSRTRSSVRGDVTLFARPKPGPSAKPRADDSLVRFPSSRGMRSSAPLSCLLQYPKCCLAGPICGVRSRHGTIPRSHRPSPVPGSPDTKFQGRLFDRSANHSPIIPRRRLTGRIGAKELAGKDVVIGIGTDVIGDPYFIPGYGKASGSTSMRSPRRR